MTSSRLNSYFGFTRTPFGRDLAPGMLHRHASFEQAATRAAWCVNERAIGVITGEVGVGKTAAVRSVLTTLDPSRHSVIYIHNPAVGVRGIHMMIVTALGGQPAHHTATLIPQTADTLAAEHHVAIGRRLTCTRSGPLMKISCCHASKARAENWPRPSNTASAPWAQSAAPSPAHGWIPPDRIHQMTNLTI